MNRPPEMRITDVELGLLKTTFGDNDNLLKLLRKVFLPEIAPDVPIGQQIDLFMTIKIEDMTPDEAIINLKARNSVIQHLEMCLNQLKILAGTKLETVEETKKRLSKDSNK